MKIISSHDSKKPARSRRQTINTVRKASCCGCLMYRPRMSWYRFLSIFHPCSRSNHEYRPDREAFKQACLLTSRNLSVSQFLSFLRLSSPFFFSSSTSQYLSILLSLSLLIPLHQTPYLTLCMSFSFSLNIFSLFYSLLLPDFGPMERKEQCSTLEFIVRDFKNHKRSNPHWSTNWLIPCSTTTFWHSKVYARTVATRTTLRLGPPSMGV